MLERGERTKQLPRMALEKVFLHEEWEIMEVQDIGTVSSP